MTLVDAYGPGNSRSSSGDESRILRCGYGSDEIYSRFARRSRELWCELEARNDSGLRLWHPCGVLWMAPDDHTYTTETLATLQRGRYAVEVLDQAAIHSRYPHLVADGVALAMLEPEGGVVMARRSVQALTAELSRKGVLVRRGRAWKPSAPGRVSALRLLDRTELRGALFVFACGAWLPAVFPELLGQRITPTRQVVMYFGTPAGDDRFTATHTPAWIDFASGIYGIPDLERPGHQCRRRLGAAPAQHAEVVDRARPVVLPAIPRRAAQGTQGAVGHGDGARPGLRVRHRHRDPAGVATQDPRLHDLADVQPDHRRRPRGRRRRRPLRARLQPRRVPGRHDEEPSRARWSAPLQGQLHARPPQGAVRLRLPAGPTRHRLDPGLPDLPNEMAGAAR